MRERPGCGGVTLAIRSVALATPTGTSDISRFWVRILSLGRGVWGIKLVYQGVDWYVKTDDFIPRGLISDLSGLGNPD